MQGPRGPFLAITPRRLIELTTSTDSVKAPRAFEAMIMMRKIDLAKIEAAAAKA